MNAVAAGYHPPATRRLAGRFFWKECRRLWGLALGVGLITLPLMAMVVWLTPPNFDANGAMIVAFGGGMMLAIAAAVTLFSVEKEEGTADLLMRLPRNRQAIFLGKLGAAAAVVMAMTLLLTLAARAVAGGWPEQPFAAMGCLFLLEALVWGLVASLACPNPLVAAVLAMAAASASSQLAIAMTPEARGGYTAIDYAAATPARLGWVALGVFVVGWLASRWPAPLLAPRLRDRATPGAPPRSVSASSPHRSAWRGAFFRLVWQSFRQSWKTALVVTLLGVFLTVAYSLIAVLSLPDSWSIVGYLGLLITPALLGAVVFRADQRRNAYRFQSEHAGRPRTLWLARNLTWLAPLGLILAGLIALAYVVVLQTYFARSVHHRWMYWNFDAMLNPTAIVADQMTTLQRYQDALFATSLSVWSALAAYAFGQFYSIAVRSDVFAGLLAVLTSVLLVVWAMVVAVWRLPPLIFVGPLAVGAFAASVLRARDWMFDRHGLWRWALPAAAILAPIALVAWRVPAERLAQLDHPFALFVVDVGGNVVPLDSLLSDTGREFERGREVNEAYLRLASQAENATPEKPFSGEPLDELIELSRVDCRLLLDRVHGIGDSRAIERVMFRTVRDGMTVALDEANFGVIEGLADPSDPSFRGTVDLDGQLERLLASRRIAMQQENGGPIWLGGAPQYLAYEILEWSQAEGQSVERVRHAIEELAEVEKMRSPPHERLMNEVLAVRDIVAGREPPSFLKQSDPKPTPFQWLAFLSNQAPSERQRSLEAVDILATFAADNLAAAERESAAAGMSEANALEWRRRLQWSGFYGDINGMVANRAIDEGGYPVNASIMNGSRRPSIDEAAYLARQAHSSQLVASEFPKLHQIGNLLRDWARQVAWRRAERVRLALVAYRLKHGAYPEELESLVPDFLTSEEIRDPYSTDPFGYAPEGFELRLSADGDFPSSVSEDAPPRTPTLWCVGSGSMEPHERLVHYGRQGRPNGFRSVEEDPNGGGHDELSMVLSPPTGRLNGGSDHFWMPLPK